MALHTRVPPNLSVLQTAPPQGQALAPILTDCPHQWLLLALPCVRDQEQPTAISGECR